MSELEALRALPWVGDSAIVYVDYFAADDGTGERQLRVATPGEPPVIVELPPTFRVGDHVAVRPGTSEIAFSSKEDDEAGNFIGSAVRVLDVLDPERTHAVDIAGMSERPTWSPSGDRMVFWNEADDDGPTNWGLFITDLTGAPVNVAGDLMPSVSDDDDGLCDGADWSPDGLELIVPAYLDDEPGLRAVSVLADGGGHDTVFGDSRHCGDFYSNDGSKLLFDGVIEGVDGLWLVGRGGEAEGGGGRRMLMAASDQYRGQFRWSPDGARIAFVEYVQGVGAVLSLLDVETGNTETIADLDSGVSAGRPEWSPDGHQLAFTAYHRNADLQGGYAQLMVYDVTKGEVVEAYPLGRGISGPTPKWITLP